MGGTGGANFGSRGLEGLRVKGKHQQIANTDNLRESMSQPIKLEACQSVSA